MGRLWSMRVYLQATRRKCSILMKEMVLPLGAAAISQLHPVSTLGFAANSAGSLESLSFHILLMHLSGVLD
jgi:hypothetical protein